MQNINFNPTTIHVKVGETVTWTNRDDAPHNVTYASGPTFASSPTFTRGESWSLKLTKPGLIRYFCTIHPGMDGSIVVGR
jgi:amicyanin